MIQKQVFSIKKNLSHSDGIFLYRAFSKIDQKDVLLKIDESKRPVSYAEENLKNVFHLLKEEDLHCSLKPLRVTYHNNKAALIYEDFKGVPLKELLAGPMDSATFFKIARAITEAIAELHRHNIIHKNIRPEHILVDLATNEIKLIGFSQASKLKKELLQNIGHSLSLESLPYVAPEQTGKINRSLLDDRCDLYSLGVVFFQMLTGELPFTAHDPLEWIHCHMARLPIAAKDINQNIDPILSKLIGLLLEKQADDRYQTASGLAYDLACCEKAWREKKNLSDIALRKNDFSHRLLIPQKLYAREREMERLAGDFNYSLSQGASQMTFLLGQPGVGKSSLVREFQKGLLGQNVVFVSAKFDSLKKDINFSTIAQSFAEVILSILLDSEENMARWKVQIENVLGENGQVIVNVIPELEFLIGPQRPVARLSQEEEQIRFKTVFYNFVQIFAKKERPLVMFLDDLQWADVASLELINYLLTHRESHYFFAIGAYRENEVNEEHLLTRWIATLRETTSPVSFIEIHSLDKLALTHFLADTLKAEQADVQLLAELLFEKTGGNPFFVIQFLTSLYDDKLLSFNQEKNIWTWDIEKVHARSFTDNVVSFIAQKIRRLPPSTQDLLTTMALMGPEVEIALLEQLMDKSAAELRSDIWHALNNGIIFEEQTKLRFVHDRLFEAAESLIPVSAKDEAHLKMALSLNSKCDDTTKNRIILELARHFNLASDAINDVETEKLAAETNLEAALKAKNANAFDHALYFCEMGQNFLGLFAWNEIDSKDYDISWSLTLLKAECALALGKLSLSEEVSNDLFFYARTRLEKARAIYLKVSLFTAKGMNLEALQCAFTGMELYHLPLQLHPGKKLTDKVTSELLKRLKIGELDTLLSLPRSHDPEFEAAMEILAGILPSAYFYDLHLHRLVSAYMMQFTLDYGMTYLSPMAFAAFGLELCSEGKYEESGQFGRLAIAIIERHQFIKGKQKVYHILGAAILPWTENLAVANDFLARSIKAEDGDPIFASLCKNYEAKLRLMSGENLSSLENIASECVRSVGQRGYGPISDVTLILIQFIHCLQGKTQGYTSFSDSHFDEDKMIEKMESHPLKLVYAWYYIYKLMAAVLYNDYPLALNLSQKVAPLLILLRGQQSESEFTFHTALALTGILEEIPAKNRRSVLIELEHYLALSKKWSSLNPSTFLCRYELLLAEMYRLKKKYHEAEIHYTRAITSAREGGFVNIEAMSLERAANFYKSQGMGMIYETYLEKAVECYRHWGAMGKVSQLAATYPELKQNKSPNAAFVLNPVQMDLLSAMKASLAVSSILDYDQLILTLLDIALEHTGAQAGQFIIDHHGELLLKAEAKIMGQGLKTEIFDHRPLTDRVDLPVTLIKYVQRIKERLIFDDPLGTYSKFSHDPYIQKIRPKSVLCLPLLRGSELIGILYLENRIVPGVFSSDRLSLLDLIITQAAISLENATLFKSMKEENAQRKLAEEALRASQSELKKSIEARDDFISIASHELRTPLTPLRMYLDMLKKSLTDISPEVLPKINVLKNAFNKTDQSLDRLNRLTNELLDVSRITSGKMELDKAPMNLTTLVQAVLDHNSFELKNSKSILHLELEEISGVWDKSRIEQVINNIYSNAIKYGEGKEIRVALKRVGDWACIIIQDNGIGISKEHQEKIFERFVRATSIKHFEGLGLGLFISREIVEAHQGRIKVESSIGHGSTFSILLPL